MPEKFTVEESKKWLTENIAPLCNLDDSEFIQAIHDLKGAMPKKPRVSRKTPDSERIDADYDEVRCDARIWLKGGHGCQCTNKKVDGQFFCKRHQKESDGHGGVTKNGNITTDRPTHHYGDESLDIIPWHDVVIEKPPPKEKNNKSSGAERKTRTCGNCGEVGHDKRKCPKSRPSDTAKPMSVSELEQMLAAAKIAEQQKVVEETVQEVVEETVQENVQETVQETVQEESDLEEDPVDIAAGVGLSESQIATGDAMVDDEDEDEDEGGDSSAIDCSFEGVSYTRDSNNVVFDDDFDDVGKWVDGAIVFDKFGIKSQKKSLAQL